MSGEIKMKRGFMFVEIIVGLAIFGLVSVTSYNLLKSSFANTEKTELKLSMTYTCQEIVEELKSNTQKNEALFTELLTDGSYIYTSDKIEDKYICEIKLNKIEGELIYYTCKLTNALRPEMEVSFECSRFIK